MAVDRRPLSIHNLTMLPSITKRIAGLFITGTDTGIGKTIVTAAIGAYFARRGLRVAVSKPLASGCPRMREGLVSEDAEFLAAACDCRFALNVICPQCFAEPLAPAVAAERAGETIDWEGIERSWRQMSGAADLMLIEGVGGLLVPLDHQHTVLDLARATGYPVLIVARPGLGTINHCLLTIAALRAADLPIAGVVINAYPAEAADVAEETNPRMIERFGQVPVLCLVPRAAEPLRPQLTPDIHAAIETVDWSAIVGR